MTIVHDGTGLEESLAEYMPRLARFIATMAPGAEVEDIVQETLLKITNGWERFRGDSALSTWMFQIASNTLSDYYRARKNRIIVADTGAGAARADTADSPLNYAENKEMSDCLEARLGALPRRYARALILAEIEGKKMKEIAQMEGTSENSIKTRLYRARGKLRSIIESSCDTALDERNVMVCHPKNRE
ncbi:hypothetical protein MNBD_NITROSPINAE02-157 [hydrothermal vent metagenome]|uniref:Uncharacterized protein n=1 Tax=hydrothermal vent metagenome TaxID=652676 RepID=A0A3B1CBE4_9ZZZZ